MTNSTKWNWKDLIDKFLIVNVFVILAGFILFLVAVISSAYGYITAYELFQTLWTPLLIPAISIFFTAIFIESIGSRILNNLRKYNKK